MRYFFKLFLSVSVCFLCVSSTSFEAVQSSVYICTGKYSKKYHYNKKCRGMSNCKSAVKSVSLKDAQSQGKTLCGFE